MRLTTPRKHLRRKTSRKSRLALADQLKRDTDAMKLRAKVERFVQDNPDGLMGVDARVAAACILSLPGLLKLAGSSVTAAVASQVLTDHVASRLPCLLQPMKPQPEQLCGNCLFFHGNVCLCKKSEVRGLGRLNTDRACACWKGERR